MQRTTLTFPSPANLWPTFEAWARTKGFRQVDGNDTHRVMRRGIGFLVAPTMLTITEQNGTVTLQAWIKAGIFVRAFALFLLPAEMGIQSGGFKLSVPRKVARNSVNELLGRLQQPPIP